jgi:hypothetical protein
LREKREKKIKERQRKEIAKKEGKQRNKTK